PAQGVDARHIEKFTRRAVRPRNVKLDFSAKADHLGDQAGKIDNRNIFAGADIEKLQIRIALHDKHAGVGEIVDRQEFAARQSGAPYAHARTAIDLSLVKTPDQRGGNVTVLRVIIVARTIKIGRHHRDKIGAVLQAIGFAQFD